MAYFPETVRAISSLPPNMRLSEGNHLDRRQVVGRIGEKAEDKPFVFGQHIIQDINPTSLMGEILDAPHVSTVQPGRRSQTSIIVGPMEKLDDPRIRLQKQRVASKIAETLFNSMAQTSDSVRLLVVEDTDIGDVSPVATRLTRIDSDRELAENCRRGLSFLISDFSDLKDANVNISAKPVIGLKINHILERELPKAKGLIGLGNGYEVDLANGVQVDQVNARLDEAHNRIIGKLNDSGIKVVSVVVDNMLEDGFNPKSVDASLASAVTSLKHK